MASAATRRWPALDIFLRPSEHPEVDADLEGHLLAFLDDHAPTSITAPPGAEDGWLAAAAATSSWLPAPEPTLGCSTPHAWRVFFATPDARDAAAAALTTAGGAWAGRVDVAVVDVEDEGWAERSQAALKAVQVGRVIVAPPWDVPTTVAASDIIITIEPSMGFGTGHHQSTRLCLQALQAIDLTGRRVLDLGTGSGVLAIAAARLGAASVLALDDDPDAVDAARANVRLNGVDADERVVVRQVDLKTLEPQAADIVLANLTGALLMRHAESIIRHIGAGGLAVLSGFTEDERFAIAHAYRDLRVIRDDREDGWVGLTLAL